MVTEKTFKPLKNITEEKVLSKPKYQVILSLIAYFQEHNATIQRAHLIRALVKNKNPSSLQKYSITDIDKKIITSEKHFHNTRIKAKKQCVRDKNLLEKGIIDRLQVLNDISPKIMFNSTAHLDKTVQQLRKLGLITNQYMKGYPRIILTHKGYMVFLTLVYPSFIFQTIANLINKLL